MAASADGSVSPRLAAGSPGVSVARERRVLGLISVGHFFSHYYGLVLPPLFPFLKAEFGVSYLQLGLAMTAYSLLGGVAQSPVGFLVDRVGAGRVLLVGLGLNALAILSMGAAGSYWVLLTLAVLAGLGNSVFHPADYAILNGAVREEKLGRAFSIHTFSGFLGGACAPLSILLLAQWTSWRTALSVTGAAGLLTLLVMMRQRALLAPPAALVEAPRAAKNACADSGDGRGEEPGAGSVVAAPTGVRLLMTPPVLLFLLFFILYGMSSGGLIAFTVTGLVDLHGITLADANTALSGHLFGVVGGILLAGVLVDRFPRHLLTATVALLLAAAACVLVVLASPSSLVLIALMVLAGFGLGAVLPARDLMLRALTPPGQIGKVFGFVFVGYSIGMSIAPMLFGWFLDHGQPARVFNAAAVFAVLALAATAAARHCAPHSKRPVHP